jgi:hypothetical protein
LKQAVELYIILKEINKSKEAFMSRFLANTASAGRALDKAWARRLIWRAENTENYVLVYRRRLLKAAGAYHHAVITYYLLKGTIGTESKTTYGVSVVSRSSGATYEMAVVKDICTDINDALSLLRLLKKHLVTPITLHDVVEDWLC